MLQMALLNWCKLIFFYYYPHNSMINFYSFKHTTIKLAKNINKENFNWKW